MKEAILIKRIQKALTPDLLKEEYKNSGGHYTYGHCYAASEALYHILGGKEAGLRACVGRGAEGTHWWVIDRKGNILDPTAEQFTSIGQKPPYAKGRCTGFLTSYPSKRAAEIIRRVIDKKNPGEFLPRD
jgi:hypothetical protein